VYCIKRCMLGPEFSIVINDVDKLLYLFEQLRNICDIKLIK
jgi:hypothetical protein